jgi:RimJ/RimL family protein N-acetyltransferase
MSTMLEIPTLRTRRLILRGFRVEDWDGMAAMYSDMAVMEWYGGQTRGREEVWALIERHIGQWAMRGYGFFAVEMNGQFAGRVGILHPAELPEPELAWGIVSGLWGQGLATEAARTARDWAFSAFGWKELASFIVPANLRSRRVAEKLGATIDGSITIRGVAADRWVHRLG